MNVGSEKKPTQASTDPAMKRPLITSLVFHFVIFLIAVFGLPHMARDIEISEPVSVELVPISELTTTNKKPVKAPPKEEKKDEPPPPKQEELKKPPTVKESTPEEEVEEKEPEPKKVEEAEAVIPKEEKKPKEEKPKEPPKKKKPEKKPPEKKDEKAAEDFDALLKNLAEEKPQAQTEESTTEENTSPEPAPNVSRFSDQLSMSEKDALRQQLAACWNIMAGAMDSQDLSVEVRLFVNPDRTVREAKVLDQSRYNSDTFFRAAADSALRAVRNPMCSPLNLPPDKYDEWKEIVVNFDPREMF